MQSSKPHKRFNGRPLICLMGFFVSISIRINPDPHLHKTRAAPLNRISGRMPIAYARYTYRYTVIPYRVIGFALSIYGLRANLGHT